jgi:hypothetical protein
MIRGVVIPIAIAAFCPNYTIAGLLDELRAAYPVTTMDPNGKVAQAGVVLAVQKPGLQANPAKQPPFTNTYDNGRVGAKDVRSVVRRIPGIPELPGSSRQLALGEKVYLTDLDVRTESKDDLISVTVRTCGDCDPAAVDPTIALIGRRFSLSLCRAP